MAEPYIGEIRMFGGNFAPVGWAFCSGQTVPIAENDVLFTLIGTIYGGDGQVTFALPDLQGRVPVHQGTSTTGTTYQIGEASGAETVTLTTDQIPTHDHTYVATLSPATQSSPAGGLFANASPQNLYLPNVSPTQVMAPQLVSSMGGSQPHGNMMPFLCVSFIISLFGIFPSRN